MLPMFAPWVWSLLLGGFAVIIGGVLVYKNLDKFIDKVIDVKNEKKALEAKIYSIIKKGKYNEVKVNLTKKDGEVVTEVFNVNDDIESALYVGKVF
ncbi:hypothetical protein DCO58_09085 [Helicobacter saguini]|uniref:Uncharacterized protein n=1 Tax=Helicobacter saguini TaxID=1548018 RepID=A0A347VP36_9HELI|nr:hypothetical protein [Helicobacter saguini]MWV61527.1 hypothetical protein [Helicobacter saguini]MWV67803.1 hypothetical protein [Helicobacter saguini]MWV70729.1 hypothetical protein [Helicobacter saguini]MWV72632.1 hypothetical protein [Helicobacter saguini]TLD94560.1 hypothetical protein LS64_005185 [Helicobacter saguini]